MKLIAVVAGAFALLILFGACSRGGGDGGIGDGGGRTGELTRDLAADLLQEYFERTAPLEWRNLCSGPVAGDLRKFNIDPSVPEAEVNAAFARLQSQGYITDWLIEISQLYADDTSYLVSASLTDSGGKYLEIYSGDPPTLGSITYYGDPRSGLRLAPCELRVEQVTGIRPGLGGVVVEYTFRGGPTEPFEILGPLLEHGPEVSTIVNTLECRDEADLLLFDDGWRVDSAFSFAQEC